MADDKQAQAEGAGRRRKRSRDAGKSSSADGEDEGSDVMEDDGFCDEGPMFPLLDERDDPSPHLRRGAEAGLGPLRRAAARGCGGSGCVRENLFLEGGRGIGKDEGSGGGGFGDGDGPDEDYEGPGTRIGGGEEEEDDGGSRGEEQVLIRLPRCSVTFVAGGPCGGGGEDGGFRDVRGEVCVTTRRLFFVAEGDGGDEQVEADDRDLSVDAGCVSLHAVSSEGLPGHEERGGRVEAEAEAWHVYCQLSGSGCHNGGGGGGHGDEDVGVSRRLYPIEPELERERSGVDGLEDDGNVDDVMRGDTDGGGGPTEVYFAPLSDDGLGRGRVKDQCQRLFDALSRMAALNPIFDDNDEHGGGGAMGGLMAMMAGFGGMGGSDGIENSRWVVAGQDNDNDDGDAGFDDDGADEMVFRIGDGGGEALMNGGGGAEEDGDEGATAEEREAMLRRLDAMLIVPRELEIQSDDGGGDAANLDGGQFDDAEEDEALM